MLSKHEIPPEHLPPKKRCTFHRRKERREREAFPTLLVRLCAGGSLGCCKLSERRLGILPVLDIDIRPEYLGWCGDKVHVFSDSKKHDIFDALRRWNPRTQGPFKLAAQLEYDWLVPEVEYPAGVGVLKGGRRHDHSDLNTLFGVVRSKFPKHSVVVLASPPCRLFSTCNSTTETDDMEAYLDTSRRFYERLRYSKDRGFVDRIMVECSAPGRWVTHQGKRRFVPGKCAEFVLDALGPGYSVEKHEAAGWGSPSRRYRLLFAEKDVFEFLPDALPERQWRGWGPVVGVPNSSRLCVVERTWRSKWFAGKRPTEPSPCITTMSLDMYYDNNDEDEVSCVSLDAVSLAKTLGCDPFDDRLTHLAKMNYTNACNIVGIGYSPQWYAGVMTAQLAALAAVEADVTDADGRRRIQQQYNTKYWELENWRRARHPAPVPGAWVRAHKRRLAQQEQRERERRRTKRRRRAQ